MGTFFVYILKSAFCLALFYLFYRLLLSKETFHRFNRVALLGLLVASCVVPLIQVGAEGANEINRQFLSLEEMLLMAEPMDEVGTETLAVPTWGWKEMLLLLYIIGIVFFLIRNLWSLGRMIGLIDGCRKEKMDDGILLFTHRKEIAPFSWMKCIVLSEKDLDEGGEAILTHERAHIANRHSWDLLLADVCVFFQWFNPAAWLLKQELQNIHEYEADEWVINQGIDAKKYQLLLIKKAVGTRLYSMANSLNHSSLKKRITMMIKKKSNPWARLKYLYILPLAAASIAAFARPEVSNSLDEISSAKVSDLASIMKADGEKNVENISKKKGLFKGTVLSDVDGQPIIGAAVIIKGTTNGTITDFDGIFMLEVSEGDVLSVSYIGYHTTEISVPALDEKGKASGTVRLKKVEETPANKVDEIVVVGYGVKKQPVDDAPLFQVAEEMPQYPGGMPGLMQYIGRNMKYPMLAQEQGLEGRVIVQFIVERDGSTSNFNIMRGVHALLDAEAIRVLAGMEKWTPGKQKGQAVRVKYTVPVTFRLDKPKAEDDIQVVSIRAEKDVPMGTINEVKNLLRKGDVLHLNYKVLDDTTKVVRLSSDKADTDSSNPLIVVDGESKGMGTDVLSTINPKTIEKIDVLKEKSATQLYGEAGKNGVIIITTKKNK